MNLILLTNSDFHSDHLVRLQDERFQHIKNILRKEVGQPLTVGLLNGLLGQAVVQTINNNAVELYIELQYQPPKPLPLSVVLALPRPQMLKRIMQNIAEFGIKEVHLIHSQKVEKSFWQTPNLREESLQGYLELGLMQAKDTVLPSITMHKQFKPFVEGTLPKIIQNKQAFIAHPYQNQPMPAPSSEERVIVIGPEGGFTNYEVELIMQQGVTAFSMGPRIYKVENAVTILAAQLSTIAG